jgi:hypothetical protein
MNPGSRAGFFPWEPQSHRRKPSETKARGAGLPSGEAWELDSKGKEGFHKAHGVGFSHSDFSDLS